MSCPKLKFVSLVVSGALGILSAQARTISENIVLQEDTDWTGDGVVTVEAGAILDLAGHKLTVSGLAGAGVVTSSVAAVYQRLEYLESTGTAYINTGYTPISATTADLRLRFTGNLPTGNGTWKSVFGTRKTGSANKATYFGVFTYKQNGNVYFWKSLRGDQDAVTTGNGIVTTGVDYYLQLDKDGASTINGREFGGGLTGNCSYPALLFAMNQDGDNAPWNGVGNAAGQRLYYCRFAESGTVVHDFVPARRLTDGVLGMYDRTTGTFKTNAASSGSFTGGSARPDRSFATGELHLASAPGSVWNCAQLKVSSSIAVVADGGALAADADWRALGTVYTTAGEVLDLAGHTLKVSGLDGSGTITGDSAYEYLDYIQGSGSQYINTGYTMGSGTTADFKARFIGLPVKGNWQGVFGMRKDGSDKVGACVFLYNNAGTVNFWRTLNGDANVPGLGAVGTGVDYMFHVDKTGTGPTTITGGMLDHAVLGTALGGTCAGPAYIFNLNQNGVVWDVNRSASMRLYSLTFSENGTVVRDYLPVRRKTDNAVGLYERLGHMFYANNGTGTFTVGAVTNATDQALVSELHVDVPEGIELENRDVSIQGNVKFVKDGPGVFIPSKGGQLYTGGTLIAAGEFRCAMCNDNGRNPQYFGVLGSEVTVAQGARLNLDGNANHKTTKFVLAGGEIHSDTDHGMSGHAWICDLRLTADSKISGAEYGFDNNQAAAMTVDLGGHTLTLDVPPSKSFYVVNTTFTGGGKLVANTGGWINLGMYDHPCTFADGTTFEVRGTAINALQPTIFDGTYESRCSQNNDAGPGVAMSVAGRFRPVTELFHSTVMKNGSTLDLNAQTGIFTTPCYFSASKVSGTLAFESNAVVTVDISSRTPALYEKLVAWSERPRNVTFVFDAVTAARGVPAVVAAGGLYYGADPESRLVDQAWWTGAAGDGAVDNPANWACTNAAGRVVTEALPGTLAAVHMAGEVALQIPVGKTLAFNTLDLDGVRLSADCDWRGLGNASALNGMLDLNGHGLTISALNGSGTITDTSKSYVAIEYLQSQDDKQFIDTGVVQDITSVVDMKVQFGRFPGNNNWVSYFGARNDNARDSQFGGWLFTTGGKTYHWKGVKSNEGSAVDLGAVNTSTIYNVHLEKNGPCTINGAAFDTGSGGSCGATMYLFAMHRVNMSNWTSSQVKFYSCAIQNNGDLVRDYVPARRLSDGVLGMYDKVHDQFYVNTGTGTFNGGTPVYEERFAAGELIVDVPEGQTVTANTVNLTGGLKLVKRGAGTLVVGKAGQTFAGGTLISAGQLTLGNASALANTTPVEVATNGVFEVNGNSVYQHKVILNGGTMQNTTADIGDGIAQLSDLRLVDDSTMTLARNFGSIAYGYALSTFDLGGKTLTVNLGSSKYFYLFNTLITNGVVNITSGGWTQIGKDGVAGVDARTVDFRVGSALRVYQPFNVHGYEAAYDWNANLGTAAMNVYGWFKPTCAYFYGCTLQDGVTLDLSALDGAWSTTSAFSEGAREVTFATGAHVTVGLGDRTLPVGGKIVDWTENAPTNLTSLTFALDAAGRSRGLWLTVKPDEGIFVSGGMIIILR